MNDRFVAWTLVGLQVVLLVALVLVPTSDDWLELDGPAAVLVAIGVGLGLWSIAVFGRGVTPSPLPAAPASMVTRGPYRWIRHPMYTAVLILSAGVVLGSRNMVALVLFVVLAGFFVLKARWEERRLDAAYPGYAAYAATAGRFVPRLRSLGHSGE